jgi:hypothetical protein
MLPLMVKFTPAMGLAGDAVGAGAVSTAVAVEARPKVDATRANINATSGKRRTATYSYCVNPPADRVGRRSPLVRRTQ